MARRKKSKDTLSELEETASVVSRYRLSVVCEAEAPFDDALPCGRPRTAARFARKIVAGAAQEMLGAIYLDRHHKVIGYSVPFLGTLTRCAVEPRQLLTIGLLLNAAGFLVFHNHPSGDPSPSCEDLSFTRRLGEAAEVVGVSLIDHIVLGEGDRWVSLRERGVF